VCTLTAWRSTRCGHHEEIAMTLGTADGTERDGRRWWDWRLLLTWIVVNAAAYIIIVAGGVVLEMVASNFTRSLAEQHRLLGVLVIAVLGAGLHGVVLGRWQWRILVTRMPTLTRRQWVTATFVPALIVWLLAIAPEAVDILAQGGDTFAAFKNGFIQALVLGPLIGLSQATALRADTTRWMWWFAANVTTYLVGAAAYEFGRFLLAGFPTGRWITPAFPLLGFLIHGVWMLWVTAPEAAARQPPHRSESSDSRT
jgi:hypothetical protein